MASSCRRRGRVAALPPPVFRIPFVHRKTRTREVRALRIPKDR